MWWGTEARLSRSAALQGVMMCLDGAEAAAGIVVKGGLEGLLSGRMWVWT